MLEYLEQEANITTTENGAITYASTGSECLDLFSTIGAIRRESEQEIIDRFLRAYMEEKDLAMKLLFFARDIRGGLGERRVFRTIFRWLAYNKPESVIKNIPYVAEFGRFDDILTLIDTPCEAEAFSFLKQQFDADLESLKRGKSVSLLGKWLPSVNASSADTVRLAKKTAAAFGMNEASYRKALSALRAKVQILENYLRERDYTFAYEKQPSRALFRYRQAFVRNDAQRYFTFLEEAASGKVKLHADHISPYELVEPFLGEMGGLQNISPEEEATLNATWEAMPDYGGNENAIAVIDTSASMYGCTRPIPAAVALSLGLYFAERNKGIFRNRFIEFSRRPRLIRIKGDTFADRLRYISTFQQIADTNLEAVFRMILKTAVRHKVPQSEFPAKLIIISDMEFNCCMKNAGESNFENAKKQYREKGYHLPEVVFWNVASRNRQQPVTMNEQGVTLISGCTPRIFSMVTGGTLSPYRFMMETLLCERYQKITA